VAIPAALLVGLWGYAATGLVGDELQAHDDSSLATSVGGPAYTALTQLQEERRLTATWQADHLDASRAALAKARSNTDKALQDYRQSSASALSGKDLTGHTKDTNASPVDALNTALVKLSGNRSAVDRHALSETKVFQYYTDTISDFANVIEASTTADDRGLARAGDAATFLVQFSEMLSREDALLSGALASGQLPATTRTQFAQYVAIQRHIRTALLDTDDLPGNEAAAYERLVSDPQFKSLSTIEDAVTSGSGSTKPPSGATAWRSAADTVDRGLQDLGGKSFKALADDGSSRADELLMQFILGSLAVIAALVVTGVLVRRATGSASHRLTQLQQQIRELGEVRLPEILQQLDRGEHIEQAGELPVAGPDADELERLGVAVGRLGQEFEAALVRQARGREGTEKVFANLTRRTQILVHRLISLLDDLERKHEDSDLLQDIFKVDHLATRVRRHSENLVILGGSAPGRRGIRPLSITDVVRGAVSETEQYRRVAVQSLPPGRQVLVAARAVTDITHLLAELIENGTTFSPPDTQVQISARKVAKGLALHVEDRGLGMPPEQYEHLNGLLAKPPQPDMDALGKDPRLGLFVVAKLAERHGLKVSLRESDYGGTLAVVLVPAALLEEHESSLPKELKAAAGFPGSSAPVTFPNTFAAEPVAAAPKPKPPVPDVPVAPGVPLPRMPAAVTVPDILTAHATSTPPQFETHGFPDYGGAGLLPSSSDGQEAVDSPSTWPPVQQHSDRYAEPYVTPYENTPYSAPYAAPNIEYVGPSAGLLEQEPSAGFLESEPSVPLEDPQVLPTRTRGASLAMQLREEAAPPRSGREDVEEDVNKFTPGRSAANMMAIQRESRRAREGQASRTAEPDGLAESRQNGTDEL
jgi:signal transduction histidine kinase